MATFSSVPAWKNPTHQGTWRATVQWGGGSQRVGNDLAPEQLQHTDPLTNNLYSILVERAWCASHLMAGVF